ncbi:uncharacterized protein LOC118736164 [Rhagoletis pomonella]|uniref:uncharacterized protein LOC118736164 n=1 Tax=Rhagoletis pomonella TaxID=28610 RepID=UPI00177E8156|nr:uncharacterized protein LOC118736164 [Rhagoletis pomonella]
MKKGEDFKHALISSAGVDRGITGNVCRKSPGNNTKAPPKSCSFPRLLLIPNGESLGYWFGDNYQEPQTSTINTRNGSINLHRVTASENIVNFQSINKHPWGIFFTVLGTVLLDFDADACQSPARAYLLDICLPEDHVRGLSTFTIMAGLGGFMGYSMGAIDWDKTNIGKKLGGHVKTVFTMVTFIFTFCVTLTITSFREIPLWVLAESKYGKVKGVDSDDINMGTYDANNQITHASEVVQSCCLLPKMTALCHECIDDLFPNQVNLLL